MSTRFGIQNILAFVIVGALFLPVIPGFLITASSAMSQSVWQALWQEAQWPIALRITLISTLISLVLSLILCLLLVCGLWPDSRWEALVQRLPILLAFPHVAFASGFLLLFTEHGWLMRLLHITFPPDEWGISLGIMLGLKEAWFLLWIAASRLTDPLFIRQFILSQTLGYGPLQSRLYTLLPVLLPQLRWALLAVTAYSLSAVDVAIILGPSNPPSLAVLAWQWLTDMDIRRQAMGTLLSLLLLLLPGPFIFCGALLYRLLGLQLCNFSGKRYPQSGTFFSALLSTVTLAAFLCPFVLLALWSCADGWFYPALLPDAFTLAGWKLSAWYPLAMTCILAFTSAVLGMIIVLIWLESGTRRLDNLLMLPLLLPALLLSTGQYQALLFIGLEGNLASVIWSHLLWVVPYMLLAMGPAWKTLDTRLAIKAQTLGWSDWRILWQIKTPLLSRPLLTAFAIGFSVSVAQYLPTLYAGAGRITTVTTETVALSSSGDPQQLAILALQQMFLPLFGFMLTHRLSHSLHQIRQGLY